MFGFIADYSMIINIKTQKTGLKWHLNTTRELSHING